MSEFEYLAVFMSIIFGISTTHVMAGIIRNIYRGEINHTHFVLTAFFFVVLILDWWTGFYWAEQESWNFFHFIVIVLWSMAHYVGAITLYPPLSAGVEHPFEYRHNWFLKAFIGVAIMDMVQTWARGSLFDPPAYLPFVVHYLLMASLALYVNKPMFHRVMAWYLLLSTVSWSFIVRLFL
ncbi:MAG: hypothetical protein P8X81_04275 [Woeseiaceae bacterium]|jgi:hypothetical protein